MRARTTKLSAIGAAIGLILATAVAVAPASAAKAPASASTTTSISSSCSSFNGLVVIGKGASFSNIGLQAGDVISVTVSPARTEDRILLSGAAGGFNLFFADSAATSGLRFVVPSSTTYSLGFGLSTTGTPLTSATWTFSSTCSTSSVAPAPAPTPPTYTKPGKGKGGKR